MKIKELKQQNNPLPLFSVLGIAFIYGIFHALGPGHGKSIIASWVVGWQRSLGTILLLSVSAAALHALTAALIVGGTYILLGKFVTVSTQQLSVYLQIAEAILVIGIGLSCSSHSFMADQTKIVLIWNQHCLIAWKTHLSLLFRLVLSLVWSRVSS